MGYFLCVLAGFGLALLAYRWQPRAVEMPAATRQLVRCAALAGALLGAYGLQLPADLLGFAAPPPPGLGGDALPLGGRTVLGGLLGGWLGVEVAKRVAGIGVATGGDFALPLAVALACGRLGCWWAGCCAGECCEPAWWAGVDAAGATRFPAQLLEAGFHALAAVVLAIAARRGRWRDTRLAAYLAVYALFRFVLEFRRENPPVVAGLSWHQLLAIALAALAGGTWWRRSRRPN